MYAPTATPAANCHMAVTPSGTTRMHQTAPALRSRYWLRDDLVPRRLTNHCGRGGHYGDSIRKLHCSVTTIGKDGKTDFSSKKFPGQTPVTDCRNPTSILRRQYGLFDDAKIETNCR
ncbi:unnamed protein product [Prorocentrum cordatum]|uniref:Uncharacterized protein n=1 Tax=Prorocentrum cordatum TaxID=2364126 RepID=A0ABN9R426_9DINO|nr:unnamed protein product [Polarella glacialis]